MHSIGAVCGKGQNFWNLPTASSRFSNLSENTYFNEEFLAIFSTTFT